MKIVLIYRRRQTGTFSIEQIFHTVADELRKGAEVIEYQVGTRWNLASDVWRLRRLDADIYHVTGDIHYLALFLPHRKTVLTVHDINHYLFDLKGLRRWIYKIFWLSWPMRAARSVTSISKKTQEDIGAHFEVSDERFETIANCHGAIFRPMPRLFNTTCPVILQVGTMQHKNALRLVEALRGIKCQLVLVGELDRALKQKLSDCGVDYVCRVGLSQAEIYRQYVDSDIVAFPSLAEGFGMPIIEAQASGRPVLTSNISPMREVAGDGACLVDPLDVSHIRAGILRIIEDSQYREQLVARGLRNTVRYSPEVISGHYFDLYRRAVCA